MTDLPRKNSRRAHRRNAIYGQLHMVRRIALNAMEDHEVLSLSEIVFFQGMFNESNARINKWSKTYISDNYPAKADYDE